MVSASALTTPTLLLWWHWPQESSCLCQKFVKIIFFIFILMLCLLQPLSNTHLTYGRSFRTWIVWMVFYFFSYPWPRNLITVAMKTDSDTAALVKRLLLFVVAILHHLLMLPLKKNCHPIFGPCLLCCWIKYWHPDLCRCFVIIRLKSNSFEPWITFGMQYHMGSFL